MTFVVFSRRDVTNKTSGRGEDTEGGGEVTVVEVVLCA